MAVIIGKLFRDITIKEKSFDPLPLAQLVSCTHILAQFVTHKEYEKIVQTNQFYQKNPCKKNQNNNGN